MSVHVLSYLFHLSACKENCLCYHDGEDRCDECQTGFTGTLDGKGCIGNILLKSSYL